MSASQWGSRIEAEGMDPAALAAKKARRLAKEFAL
jgi:hypothetical protein